MRMLPWIAFLSLLAVLPSVADAYILEVLTQAFILFLAALGLSVAFGLGGQFLICQATFLGLGGYTYAVLRLDLATSPEIALAAGVAAGTFGGLLLGFASIRVRGHYLAILTIGFAIIFYHGALSWQSVTRGAIGLTNIPELGGWMDRTWCYYLLCLVLAAATGWYVNSLKRSPSGLSLSIMRDDEALAGATGLDVRILKIGILTICGMFGGLAGCLQAQHIKIFTPENVSLENSIFLLLLAALGGRGSVGGLAAATMIGSVMPEFLRVTNEWRFVLFGGGVLGVVLVAPNGLPEMGEKVRHVISRMLFRLKKRSISTC